MSNYKIPYRYDVHWGFIDNQIELNPEDYLDYEDECELNDAVYDAIWDSFSVGDLDIDQAEMDLVCLRNLLTSGRDLKAMKYDIPSKVRIANHWYKVILCDFIDNGDTFGSHCNLKLEIKVAECMKTDDGETVNLTEEQIKNSFWHEIFHAFNYYYNNKQDESLAQTFANFMREFELTRE